MPDSRNQSEIEFPDNNILVELCGPGDLYVSELENRLKIQISRRGNLLSLSGDQAHRLVAIKILDEIYGQLEEGRILDEFDRNSVIEAFEGGGSSTLERSKCYEVDHVKKPSSLEIQTKKKLLKPRNRNQKAFVSNLISLDLSFGLGPAGTGKTYLAIGVAVSKFLKGEVDKIILTRPAVEAGERLGFLPGDIKDKVDPFMQPLYSALHDFLPSRQISKMLESKTIEILPIAFMRGRTLSGSFIILDEGQNATSNQMQMFLTRIGKNSRAAVTGDLTQIDLPKGVRSGLAEAVDLLKNIREIGFTRFCSKDVVRHKLVEKIVNAYEKKPQV